MQHKAKGEPRHKQRFRPVLGSYVSKSFPLPIIYFLHRLGGPFPLGIQLWTRGGADVISRRRKRSTPRRARKSMIDPCRLGMHGGLGKFEDNGPRVSAKPSTSDAGANVHSGRAASLAFVPSHTGEQPPWRPPGEKQPAARGASYDMHATARGVPRTDGGMSGVLARRLVSSTCQTWRLS